MYEVVSQLKFIKLFDAITFIPSFIHGNKLRQNSYDAKFDREDREKVLSY